MAQPAAAESVRADERLVRVGVLARLLTRPDIGAFLGAVAVFFAFGYFARAVDWLGDPAIASGLTAIENIDSASGFSSARKLFAGDLTSYDYKVKVLWWIGLTVVGAWLLAKTRFGNWIYSAGGDPIAARNVGVPVIRTKVALFMMTSTTAALMGIIEALELRSMEANEGIGLEFIFIICAVVGGCLLTGCYGPA